MRAPGGLISALRREVHGLAASPAVGASEPPTTTRCAPRRSREAAPSPLAPSNRQEPNTRPAYVRLRLKFFPLSPVTIRLQTGFLHRDVGADYFPFHWVKGFVRHRLNALASGNGKVCPIAFCSAVILCRADCARKPKPLGRSGLGADAALPDVLMAPASCNRHSNFSRPWASSASCRAYTLRLRRNPSGRSASPS